MERRIYKLVAERGGGATTTRRKAMTDIEWECIKLFLCIFAIIAVGIFTFATVIPLAYRLYSFLCAGVC